MTRFALHGMWCATLTPLAANGSVDRARLIAHVRSLFDAGVAGVAPFGTTGEGPSFSPDERRRGLDALLEESIEPGRILAATTCADLPSTIELSRHATAGHCLGCLVLPPFFFKGVSEDGVYTWYADLIEGVADSRFRVLLYNLPQVSGVPIGPSLAQRLVQDFPEVILGVKDSGGDFAHTQLLLEAMKGRAVLVGHEPHLPQLMRAGGAGTVCGVANLYPPLVAGLLRSDPDPAAEQSIHALLDILFRFPLIPAMKSVLAWQSEQAAWHAVRPPLKSLSDDDRSALLGALRDRGFALGATR